MSPRAGLDLQTVLQTAAEIADTHGLDQVTLATIAQKLGIRPPSLYNHVDGLPGLRNKLAVFGTKQLTDKLTRAAIGRSKDDAVLAMGEAYVAFARAHPGLYEATLRAPDPRDSELQQAAEELMNVVLRVLNAYGLEEEAALNAVRGLRSLLHGFASLEQKGGFGLPLDHDASLRFVIDIFLAGIHALEAEKKQAERRP